jgi:hypothetical protein
LGPNRITSSLFTVAAWPSHLAYGLVSCSDNKKREKLGTSKQNTAAGYATARGLHEHNDTSAFSHAHMQARTTYLIASSEAKVCDQYVLLRRQQDVLELEVAMQDARQVAMVDRRHNLPEKPPGLRANGATLRKTVLNIVQALARAFRDVGGRGIRHHRTLKLSTVTRMANEKKKEINGVPISTSLSSVHYTTTSVSTLTAATAMNTMRQGRW